MEGVEFADLDIGFRDSTYLCDRVTEEKAKFNFDII